MTADPFAGFPLEENIRRRAAACGVALSVPATEALAAHARAVLEENESLHLTSLNDPDAFCERHLGESLEGAAMLDPEVGGVLLDLGSGNGYPGVVVAAARPRLKPVLVEASPAKADFLRRTLERTIGRGEVLARQVQRAGDLEGVGPVAIVVTRAMGAWEKILPRLSSILTVDGAILLWAGSDAQAVLERRAWRRLRLDERRPLPGRDRSWIWRLSRNTS